MLSVQRIKVNYKGGPKSGFHGHAGRPKHRGGSQARGVQSISIGVPSLGAASAFVESQPSVAVAHITSAADNPSEVYIKGDSVPLTNTDYMNFALEYMKDMDPKHAAAIIKELQFTNTARKDIDGLDKITTNPPAGFVDNGEAFANKRPEQDKVYSAAIAGSYLRNIINVHPSSIQSVLSHELGHHVGDHYGFEDYKKNQLMSMLARLRGTKNHVIQEFGLSSNALKNRYELFAEIYDNIKQSLAWIRIEKNVGLRSGSWGAKTGYMKHQLEKLRKNMAEHDLQDVYDALTS